jgi:Putative peptidoglycan binding domain
MRLPTLVAAVVAALWLTHTAALSNGYQGYIVSLDPVLQERIQAALRDKGFDPGPIDGKYGGKTRAALLAFRKANGVKDGEEFDEILTPNLAKALLGVDLTAGANGEELDNNEQMRILKQLGLVPTQDYWKDYVFPE